MDYKDLTLWQRNQECIRETVDMFDSLPNRSFKKLIFDQLFRSLTSVGANIAEGSGSYEGKEFPKFLNIAFKSALETDHWYETLKNLLNADKDKIESIRLKNFETIKMLISLSKSIKNKRAKEY